MFESLGELVVVSVLLGITVLAFLYLAYRGAHGKETDQDLAKNGSRNPENDSARSA